MPVTYSDFDTELAALLSDAELTNGRAATSRAASCFYYLGIRTPEDIVHYSRYDLVRVANCGRKTLAVINSIAAAAGLVLREGDGPTAPLKPVPRPRSLFDDALERFAEAFHAGTGITMTATEVAAVGSLVTLAAKLGAPQVARQIETRFTANPEDP